MRLWPRILLFSALLQAAPAHSGLSPDAYGWVVNLVESLYLHQERVRAPPLIKAAATGLADKVHWLIVDTEGDVIYLRHGNGTKLGSLSVTSMEGLPKGLQTLEEMVVGSGYSLDGVDVRLAILRGMTSGLDRYSTILSGERLDRFDVRLKGTYVSIGATVAIQADKLVVEQVDAEGPAYRAKLLAGDLLLRIDGTSTVNMPVREADRRLRGDAGSKVALLVRRDGVLLNLTIEREEVVVPNVRHRVLAGNVGYVRISHFSQRTTQNLSAALRALQTAGALEHGLVIDLRNNTGGSMKDSARSADLFVEEGMLLRTAGHDGRGVKNLQEHMQARVQDEAPKVPLVILTNDRTASGSEIMAGALVQLDRAALVGSRSFGKGTVQKIYRINNARLKLTVARYLLHGDRAITVDGLAPDLAVSDIRLDSNGMRFMGWSEEVTGTTRDNVLGAVSEHRSWRGEAVESEDLRIEVARRAVSRATSPSRAAVLDALQIAADELRAEQEELLVRALAARDIDWTSDLPPSDEPPRALVRVTAKEDPTDDSTFIVHVSTTNTGDQALERAIVELSCPAYRPWHGLAVPLGRVEAKATAEGEVRMRLHPGVNPREDQVTPILYSAGRPPLTLAAIPLRSASSQLPRLAVTARLMPGAEVRNVQITVQNLSTMSLDGVEVAFEHPGDVGVELVDHGARVSHIEPRTSARFELNLRVRQAPAAVIPLRLKVDGDRYRSSLAEWPLDLPLDGTVVVREPPRIEVTEPPLTTHLGPLSLAMTIKDETRIDHVVVFANGQKIDWAPGGKSTVQRVTPVQIEQGPNRVVIIAQDEHGLTTKRVIQIHGEADAIAAEDPVEPR